MSARRRYGPRRRLAAELAPLAAVGAMALSIALVFPCEALDPALFAPGRSAAASGAATPCCAFVELTEGEMAEALSSSRAAWHVDSSSLRRLRIEMFAGSLPEPQARPLGAIASRARTLAAASRAYAPDGVPTDCRAPAPEPLEPEPEPSSECPFTRDDMLRLKQGELP